MKILFLTPRNSKTHIGGVETHVRLLTRELKKRGHEVKELSLEDTNKRATLDPSTRRRLLARDDTLSKFNAWKYLWQKRDLFKWADVIHIHDVFWWMLPFVAIAKIANMSEKREKEIFTTFHGWEGECPPSWSAIIQKRLAKKFSNGTIGIGTFFQKWYGVSSDKVSFGVLDPKLMRLPRGRTGRYVPRNDGVLRIAFYGRLDRVNDIDIALEAFRILKGQTPPRRGLTLRNKLKFLFIGDGPARKDAEKIGTVTGMVKYPRKFLLQSDLVITSSYLCLLETAALMRPIISIATNPLKNDYLATHPLTTCITICHSPKEIADSVLSFRFVKQRENIEKARIWATRQTMKKLTDEYLNLWNEHVS